MYDVLLELSRKILVISVFGWTSESVDGIFVIFALKFVAMPLKCQQNVLVNLKCGVKKKDEKSGMRIKIGRIYLLYETLGFVDRAVMLFDQQKLC